MNLNSACFDMNHLQEIPNNPDNRKQLVDNRYYIYFGKSNTLLKAYIEQKLLKIRSTQFFEMKSPFFYLTFKNIYTFTIMIYIFYNLMI